MLNSNLKTVDLFCGCGGMSLGFSRAGFEIVSAFDNWSLALRTYKRNFAHPSRLFDLSQIKFAVQEIRPLCADIIIGGPPCQDFSIAGRRLEAERANLTIDFARIACKCEANLAIMENVYSIEKTETLKKAVRIFRRNGYGLTCRIIDASLTKVPQKRRRFFLIASRNHSNEHFAPSLDDGLETVPMTVHDYFGNSLGTEFYYAHPRNYKRRAVFSVHEPSSTIRRVNRPIPSNYVSHPADKAPISKDVRPLTTSERAAIQTFPRDFTFEGSTAQQEHQLANAVPVRLAEYVASRVLHAL